MTAATVENDGVDAVRSDGGLVHIRAVGPSDAAAIRALHARASDRSIYLRFFSVSRVTAETYVATLIQTNSPNHQAFAALVRGDLVGVASFERGADDSAEIALIVTDERQHEGIGTLLLEQLAAAARRLGVRTFTADVLTENVLMSHVLADIGFVTHAVLEHGETMVTCDLDPVDRVLERIEDRERSADAASLRAVLAPRSIAVIGAGLRSDAVGHQVLNNILTCGFAGTVHVVNPHHTRVLGVPSVPTPDELPDRVDLAIVAVPVGQVAEIVRACGKRGVRAVILLGSGFGELGQAGKALQDDVLAIARDYGMRLVGPNCVGLVNTDPGVSLNATFATVPMQPGVLGVLAQSGAFGIAFVVAAARAGMGVSQFVSVGNKADVSGNDLLLGWERDPDTRVIAMYLESINDPERFARIARRVSRSKPILAIKSGRSAAGQRAGASHTAAAASPEVAVDALFRSSGVLRMACMQDMLDAARVLSEQPLPAGSRVAIVGNSGGPGILAADAATTAGLTVVDLSADTQSLLRAAVASSASTSNPVDLGAGVTAAQVGAAVRVLLEADEVDALLTIFTDVAVSDSAQIRAAVVSASADSVKPIVATEVGCAPHSVPIEGTMWSLPVFTFPESAAAALGVAHRYARSRTAPRAPAVHIDGVDTAGARVLVTTALDSGREWLGATEVCALLACYGISVSQTTVHGIEEAVRAAAAYGYPLALKLADGGIHKTEVGGVRLDLGDETTLRRAFDDMVAAHPNSDLIVQPMISGGTEVIVGVVRDPQFGPLVMLGAGGVLVDLLDDRTFRLAPLAVRDADDMIGDLRLARLLDGYRGRPVVARSVVADVLVRAAAMAADLPEIAELDLNPLICTAAAAVAVDARVRIAIAPARRDPLVRQLRRPSDATSPQ